MCYSPITIKTPQGYRKVPCGHCLECLVKYQNDWSARMFEELKAHDGKAVFFTLTYDEQNVPKNYLRYESTGTEGEVAYRLFRSPSDYGYRNIYIDEKGRERVLPRCGRERKKDSVPPYVELQETCMDFCPGQVLDFNIKRENHSRFIKQIEKIYGDYIRTRNDIADSVSQPVSTVSTDVCDEYDFDCNSIGDFDPIDDLDFLNEAIAQVVEDDTYESGFPVTSVPPACRPVMSFNSVRKKDVQDWLKRGREKLKRQKKEFTYFITSEYGPRTLRPHYHGVIFGVTAEESACMKTDWQRHHGIQVKWEDVDLTKGDMSYCAKYCSKSFYEHPLCSKDFFYSRAVKAADGVDVLPFSEYHSKHFERCIEIFGIDEPIVDPSFKLISKGLGSAWFKNNKDLVSDFDNWCDMDWTTSDTSAVTPTVHREVAPWDDDFTTYQMKGYPVDDSGFISVDVPVERLNNKNVNSKKYEETIERLFRRFKYNRTYKDQVFAYGVPKYYRTKMFSDGLRCAFANYVQQVNVEVYREKLAELFPDGVVRETPEVVSQLEALERNAHYDRARRIYKRLTKTYNKSKI